MKDMLTRKIETLRRVTTSELDPEKRRIYAEKIERLIQRLKDRSE